MFEDDERVDITPLWAPELHMQWYRLLRADENKILSLHYLELIVVQQKDAMHPVRFKRKYSYGPVSLSCRISALAAQNSLKSSSLFFVLKNIRSTHHLTV